MARFSNSTDNRLNDVRSAMRRSSVFGILSAAVVGLAAVQLPAAVKPAVGKSPAARVDQFGDPLPEGAIARLGSVRFKHDTLNVGCIAFSPDGKLIASGGGDRTVRIWETRTGKPVAVLRRHEIEIRRFESIDLKDGKVVKTVSERKRLRSSEAIVEGLDFSPDGELLASRD